MPAENINTGGPHRACNLERRTRRAQPAAGI